MKLTSKVYWLSFFLITLNSKFVFSQNSTGINNPNPSTKAALDIQTSAGFKQGFFMPRLVGADTNAIGATIGKDRGLMFFDTLIGDVRFWDGAKWKGGGSASTVNYWQTNGNVLTAADTIGSGLKYIGTNSPTPLMFYTGGIERMRLSKTGNLAIGKQPSGGIPLQVKSNGTGTVLQIEQNANSQPLIEFRQNPNKNARLVMYNSTGTQTIDLNAENGVESNFNAGNININSNQIGLNPSSDNFVYDTKKIGNYSLSWQADSWNAFGGTSYLSGYSGVKIFTNQNLSMAITQGGNVGIGNASPSVSLDLSSRTDAIAIPVGKTSDQPTTAYKGMIRYNSENNWFEGHDGNTWNAFNTGSGTPSWNITGNVGTTSASNFLGTRDKISLRFKTNDTEYMVIDSTGKIGIGTKTPSDNLEVVSNIRLRHPNNTSTKWGIEASQVGGLQIIDRINNQRKMIFNDNGDIYLGAVPINIAGASSAMAILKAGNIGIGTLTPLSKLDINGAVAIGTSAGVKAAPANGLLVSGNVGLGMDSADVRLLVKYHALGDGSQATLRIYQHNCGSACGQKNGSAIQLINDNQTGSDQGAVLSFADPINVTNKDEGAASIALVNRNSTLGQGGLAFRTRNSAGVMAERIRISAEGLVGIGVSSPAVSLDLSSRTDAIAIPVGNTAQQPISAFKGMIRYNSEKVWFEGHDGTGWNAFLTGTSSSPWTQSGTNIFPTVLTNNVGIGINTPSERIHIYSDANPMIALEDANNACHIQGGTDLVFYTNAKKERMKIMESNGNVGIGTSNPLQTLHIASEGLGGGSNMIIEGHSVSNVRGPGITIRRSAGTIITPANVIDNAYLGGITFQGYSTAYRIAAQIEAVVNGTPTTTSVPTDLVFSTTTAGAGTSSPKMRITESGNVGIGTATPSSLLSVGASNQFQVSTTGDLVAIKGLTYSWPTTQGAGSLVNDGTGALSWANGGSASPWTQSGTTISNATGTSQVNINYTGQVGLQLNGTNTSWSSLYINGVSGANIGFGYNRAGIFKGGTYLNASDDWTVQLWDGTVTKTRLYLQSSTGYTGIGTTSPQSMLHVASGEFRVENNPSDAGSGRMRLIGNTQTWTTSFTLGQHSTGEAFLWNDAGNRMSFGLGGSEKMAILVNGNVGIGTTAPNRTLHIENTAATSNIMLVRNLSATSPQGIVVQLGAAGSTANNVNYDYMIFRRGDNTITGAISGNLAGITPSVQYLTTSDRRLKTNISVIDKPWEIVKKMKPRYYQWKNGSNRKDIGFIAQELQRVYPWAVSGDSTLPLGQEPMMVAYSMLTPILTAAIQEQQQIIDSLKIANYQQDLQLQQLKGAIEDNKKQKDELKEVKTELEQLRYDLEQLKKLSIGEAKKE